MKLRTLARPKVFLPLILAGALLAVAFSLGNVDKVLSRLRIIPLTALALTLGLAAGYLVLKAIQLRQLLRRLNSPMKWRLFLLAFSVGELAANLPLGIFAQNWVLSRQPRAHFARSSAATSFMLLTELSVALLLVAVVGIPGWGWLRPVAALVLAGTGGLLFALIHFEPLLQRWQCRGKKKWLKALLDNAMDLIDGLKRLSNWRVLAVSVALVSAYLAMLVWAFLVVGRAMGVHPLHYIEAASVYAFSLAVILMGGGIVGQVGSMEVLGMSAAHAWGVGYTDGLALMLGFRLVWIASIWLLAAPIVLWLHRFVQPDAQGSGENSVNASDDRPERQSDRKQPKYDVRELRRAEAQRRHVGGRSEELESEPFRHHRRAVLLRRDVRSAARTRSQCGRCAVVRHDRSRRIPSRRAPPCSLARAPRRTGSGSLDRGARPVRTAIGR